MTVLSVSAYYDVPSWIYRLTSIVTRSEIDDKNTAVFYLSDLSTDYQCSGPSADGCLYSRRILDGRFIVKSNVGPS